TAPRRRGLRPGRPHQRRRLLPAAVPQPAAGPHAGHPPPGGPGPRRGDRRGRRRGLRGDRRHLDRRGRRDAVGGRRARGGGPEGRAEEKGDAPRGVAERAAGGRAPADGPGQGVIAIASGVFEHWQLKLLSLVFAVALWVFLVVEDKGEAVYTVPLDVKNVPVG